MKIKKVKILSYLFSLIVAMTAFFQIFLKVESTLVGYELGKLKNKESKLLDRRSYLQMELAKLTNKSNLLMIYNHNEFKFNAKSTVSQTSL